MDCPKVECSCCKKLVRACETVNYNDRCEDCWIHGYVTQFQYTAAAAQPTPGLTLPQQAELLEWLEEDKLALKARKSLAPRYDMTSLPQKYKKSRTPTHLPASEKRDT